MTDLSSVAFRLVYALIVHILLFCVVVTRDLHPLAGLALFRVSILKLIQFFILKSFVGFNSTRITFPNAHTK